MTPAEAAARAVAAAPRPLLVAVDVDGTLSEIVPRPEDARLVPGAHDVLARLAALPDVEVVVVSGRPLHELRDQFGFSAGTRLIGSHGLQDSAQPEAELTPDEARRVVALRAELEALAAGRTGVWVEHKPLSEVLHVGRAPKAEGDALLAHAEVHLGERAGLYLVPGDRGLEVAIRPARKRPAVERLRAELGAKAVVYIGDDLTDEDVLTGLVPPDVGIRVGDRPAVAPFRLDGPPDVVALLDALARDLK